MTLGARERLGEGITGRLTLLHAVYVGGENANVTRSESRLYIRSSSTKIDTPLQSSVKRASGNNVDCVLVGI